MADIKEIAEALVNMTAQEVSELAEVLKNEYDITAAECVEKTEEGMTFGAAIEALKAGKYVARKGWNGKGMYLWLMPRASVKAEWCKEPHLKALAEANGGAIDALGSIRMLTADKKILTGWLASQTDILSEDWVIVEP